MADERLRISVAIATYRRGAILIETLDRLHSQDSLFEVLVIDQTEVHDPVVRHALQAREREGHIRWIHHTPPGVIGAMNRALVEARSEIVLFLDDDVVPAPGLVDLHRDTYRLHAETLAVVGRVTQREGSRHRGSEASSRRADGFLRRDLEFDFDSLVSVWVENIIACNFSVRRERALALGGFDALFIPPVSYRFETDFAKRIIADGGRIRFNPEASVVHLRAGAGGTRSQGGHLTSISPLHGVGDYYYALKHGRGVERIFYMLRRPFREVCTRFHLRHPWWIPLKFVGELRALRLAMRLWRDSQR